MSEEVSCAELGLQDELSQEIEEIERLITPNSKRRRYLRAIHCKRNVYLPNLNLGTLYSVLDF